MVEGWRLAATIYLSKCPSYLEVFISGLGRLPWGREGGVLSWVGVERRTGEGP